MTYKTWLEQWLVYYVKPSSKMRTYERYEQICKLHIIPNLGDYELNDLTLIDIQKFVTSLLTCGNLKTRNGLSASFVNLIITVMQKSLKTAHLIGYSAQYVADKLQRPKVKGKQVECFTLAEQKRIEQYVLNSKKDKMFGVVLCLYTGLRIGELLALTWQDIDFAKGLLFVSKTCHDSYGNGVHIRIIDTPQNGAF